MNENWNVIKKSTSKCKQMYREVLAIFVENDYFRNKGAYYNELYSMTVIYMYVIYNVI